MEIGMRFVVMAALAALGCGGAMAQQATSGEEMLCIIDNVSDEQAGMLVEKMINHKTGDEAKIDAAMKAAHGKCGTQYKWNDAQHQAAEDIAIGGMVHGVVSQALGRKGFRDLKKLDAILDGLSDADYAVVINGTYDKDAGLKPRVREQIKRAGVPDNAEALDLAFLLIETTAITDEAMNDWDAAKGTKRPS